MIYERGDLLTLVSKFVRCLLQNEAKTLTVINKLLILINIKCI